VTGIPGLAFETWDPCHRTQMETPVMHVLTEGSAVFSTG
jgi:hypothetical protein